MAISPPGRQCPIMPYSIHTPGYPPPQPVTISGSEERLLPSVRHHKTLRQKVSGFFHKVFQLPGHLANIVAPNPRQTYVQPVIIEPVPHRQLVESTESYDQPHRDHTTVYVDDDENLHNNPTNGLMAHHYPPPYETPEPHHTLPLDFSFQKQPTFFTPAKPDLSPSPFKAEPLPEKSPITFFDAPPTFNPLIPIHDPEYQSDYDLEANLPLPAVWQPTTIWSLQGSKSAPADLPSARKHTGTAAVLLGPDSRPGAFKQGTIGDCYLLAGFDAMMNHPQAARILGRIRIESTEGTDLHPQEYDVTFPSGLKAYVDAAEVGIERDGKKPLEGPDVLQLLELAYAKATRSERNRARGVNAFTDDGRCHTPTILDDGLSEQALSDMFGGESVRIDSVTDPPIGSFVGGDQPLIDNPNTVRELTDLLATVDHDPDHDYLLTAATPQIGTDANPITVFHKAEGTTGSYYRKHSYSIRSWDTKANTITIANPHDTASQVRTMSMNEFCRIFRAVSGVKLPRTITV